MILAVTENYHDYEATHYLVDSDKLDPENHVDKMILKAIKKKSLQLNVYIDASNWEDKPEFADGEPGITDSAKIKKNKSKGVGIDKTVLLKIDFDC